MLIIDDSLTAGILGSRLQGEGLVSVVKSENPGHLITDYKMQLSSTEYSPTLTHQNSLRWAILCRKSCRKTTSPPAWTDHYKNICAAVATQTPKGIHLRKLWLRIPSLDASVKIRQTRKATDNRICANKTNAWRISCTWIVWRILEWACIISHVRYWSRSKNIKIKTARRLSSIASRCRGGSSPEKKRKPLS